MSSFQTAKSKSVRALMSSMVLLVAFQRFSMREQRAVEMMNVTMKKRMTEVSYKRP